MGLEILPGNRFEMVPSGSVLDDPIQKQRYVSSVDDVIGNKLYVGMPMIHGRYAPIHKGEKYDIYFFEKEKVYMCCVVVEGAHREDNRIVLEVVMVTEPRKFDRRAFFRLPYDIPVQFIGLDERMLSLYRQFLKNGKEIPTDGYRKGACIDLSAGGIRFMSGVSLKRGDVICLQFVVEEGKADQTTFTLLAHIIETEKHPEKMGKYLHRAAFEVQHPRTREKLVAFIFKKQRQSLQKK